MFKRGAFSVAKMSLGQHDHSTKRMISRINRIFLCDIAIEKERLGHLVTQDCDYQVTLHDGTCVCVVNHASTNLQVIQNMMVAHIVTVV